MKKVATLLAILILFVQFPTKAFAAAYCQNCQKRVAVGTRREGETYTRYSDTQHGTIGHYSDYCLNCGYKVGSMSSAVIYEAHTFSNNTCTKCGYVRTTPPTTAPQTVTTKPVVTGKTTPKTTPAPISWNPKNLNKADLTKFIRNVSNERNTYGGTKIERDAIVCNQGCVLRSAMVIRDNTKITILSANTTVYVYFSSYDASGREWYYAVCPNGLEGFLSANRIMLQ